MSASLDSDEARANDRVARSGGPTVFLANIGNPSEFMARTDYVLRAFQAGGFRALTNNGFAEGHAAALAFAESDARIAVICTSDMKCEEVAEDTAADLKAAGARTVILVGDPGPKEERYREAGVDRFMSTDCDLPGMLGELEIEEEFRTCAMGKLRKAA